MSIRITGTEYKSACLEVSVVEPYAAADKRKCSIAVVEGSGTVVLHNRDLKALADYLANILAEGE